MYGTYLCITYVLHTTYISYVSLFDNFLGIGPVNSDSSTFQTNRTAVCYVEPFYRYLYIFGSVRYRSSAF